MARTLEVGDEERARYLETLGNGRRFKGYVTFIQNTAGSAIKKHLALDENQFIDLLINYLKLGGKLDCVDENRPEWKHLWRFHFDLWPDFAAKELYVETRFIDNPELDSREIIVVSVHPPDDVAWNRWPT